MSIKATERKVSEGYSLKCGVMEFLPLKLNPDKSELEELLGGKELEFEPEYLSEDNEGNDQLRLDFWGKDVNTGNIHKIQFYLKNKKVETEKDGKINKQFVNTKGFQAWADGEDNLPAYFFKDAEAHQAREGEADLLNFICSWIKVQEIILDYKKFLKGNLKDLQELFEIGKPVIVAVGVKTYEKEGEKKQKQAYFTRSFLPNTFHEKQNGIWNTVDVYKEFSKEIYTDDFIKELKKRSEENKKAKEQNNKAPHKFSKIEYFVLNVEYSFKAFYGPGLLVLHDYNSSLDITASDEVLQETADEGGDSDY